MPKRLRPFAGVDGEGGNVNGRHEYLMLAMGTDVLYLGYPLTYKEVFPWMATRDTKLEYVSYSFNYDVTMICKDLPPEVVAQLLDRASREKEDGRGHHPVTFGGFMFDHLPNKEFRVRRMPSGRLHHPWTVVSDVWTFFQSSFVGALELWGIGTPEQRELIRQGKDKRADFAEMTQETLDYNRLEIELLEDLMETFRQVCISLGIVPKRWQGPGNIASAMFEKHGIPKHDEIITVPEEVWRMAQAAYYGGRFQTTAVGKV